MRSEGSQHMESSVEQHEKWPGWRLGQTFPCDRLPERSHRLPTELGRQINARYESHNALIGGLRVESMAA
jgi:hypothetical protein